jgi:hypothetical protein
MVIQNAGPRFSVTIAVVSVMIRSLPYLPFCSHLRQDGRRAQGQSATLCHHSVWAQIRLAIELRVTAAILTGDFDHQ